VSPDAAAPASRDGWLFLTTTDLKQYAYCPRIPYYRYVMPVRSKKTYPMERGKSVQAAVEALERRRGFRRYGLAQGRRRFGLALRSERLGLSGRLDLAIETEEACYPVDFKDSDGPVRHNHRIQLAAYALLIEDCVSLRAPVGFVYRIPARDLVEVDIGEEDRAFAAGAADALRRSVLTEATPEPTAVRNRCTACEFRNYCGDVW
jgi:CRISPR-associated exonuclease Cas4